MTCSWPGFDIDALRALAGDKVFARGEACHRDAQVRIVAHDPQRVLAQVAGSQDYRVVLTGRGDAIGGECSCPAFEDFGFCKHMVATALSADVAPDGAEAEGAGTLRRIRDHLAAQGTAALVELVMELAEHDADLFRRLDLAATSALADDATIEAATNFMKLLG